MKRRPLDVGLALLAAALTMLPALGLPDEVVLKDGRSFEGKIEKDTKDQVAIRTRFGLLEFARSEVASLQRGKTTAEVFEERWQAAKSADEFHELGQWCVEKKIKNEAKRCMKRTIELDPDHEGARAWLGFVRYEGEWMTPEERDARVLAKEEADMAAKGMVRHGEGWVTREDKERLDLGMILVDGRWLTPDEEKRERGLELWSGQWLPRAQALSHLDVDLTQERAGVRLERAVSEHALVAGTYPEDFLRSIGQGVDKGRLWFHAGFGLDLADPFAGDRLPQFYVWNKESEPYLGTCDWFASLTQTVPQGWAESVKKIHGFVWWSPYCLSSARVWHRPDEDVAGHCYHHSGHLLLNRVGYDGRLLPPWFDEGFAALMEFHTHGLTLVLCIAQPPPRKKSKPGPVTGPVPGGEEGGGTGGNPGAGKGGGAGGAGSGEPEAPEYMFETSEFRRGTWAKKLLEALEAGRVEPFDELARKEYGEITILDIAMSMAIVEWLLTHEGAIARFHAVLREVAPAIPRRVILDPRARLAAYERAFQAAVQLGWKEADQAWREWFRNRK